MDGVGELYPDGQDLSACRRCARSQSSAGLRPAGNDPIGDDSKLTDTLKRQFAKVRSTLRESDPHSWSLASDLARTLFDDDAKAVVHCRLVERWLSCGG